jgi:sulfoxide reductase catalytic subunit YedY
MANLIVRPPWHLSESAVTAPAEYQRRREFLRRLGLGGAGVLAATMAGESWAADGIGAAPSSLYPAKRNPDFNPKLELAKSEDVYSYNNFYEFSTTKTRVQKLTGKFTVDPWSIRVGGLCENEMSLSAAELAGLFPLEERVYRFRCVEAWSMVVPWTGFPLAKLIEKAKPKPEAKFVKFTTVNRPDQMPGINTLSEYPWPYTEGLRMDEARHPLTLIATGLYGEPLKKQNGAPLRLVVPWKYGYKSIKSLVKIEFVAQQPATLWETLNPVEYPFESNVDPGKPHPRWSQATERVLGGGTAPTLKYNGYGDLVAKLY